MTELDTIGKRTPAQAGVGWEWMLILPSLEGQPAAGESGLAGAVGEMVEHIKEGRYTDVLSHPTAAAALQLPQQAAHDPGTGFWDGPDVLAAWFETLECSFGLEGFGQRSKEQVHISLLVAIASLSIFLQANLTGPQPAAPACPADLQNPNRAPDSVAGLPQTPGTATLGQDTISAEDRWALERLASSGEEVVGRYFLPQYLLLARTILLTPLVGGSVHVGELEREGAELGGLPDTLQLGFPVTWAWWALRTVGVQQRLLRRSSASLRNVVLRLFPQVAESVRENPPLAVGGHLSALLKLEAATLWQGYGDVAASRGFLEAASRKLDLHVELTGALGLRTMHQKEPKAQLVVRVHATSSADSSPHDASCDASTTASAMNGAGSQLAQSHDYAAESAHIAVSSCPATNGSTFLRAESARGVESAPVAAPPGPASALLRTESAGEDESTCVQGWDPGMDANAIDAACSGTQSDLAEDGSDVFPLPRILDMQGGEADVALGGLEQAALLGWAQQERRGTAADELREWRVAPFVDVVLRQRRSYPLLRWAARLLRSRHERERTRTRVRSLMVLEELAASFSNPELAVQDRLPYACVVQYPLLTALRRELAHDKLAVGLVGEAMREFETLELWDALITCYAMLKKEVQAEELVRRRLEVTPNDPRLWCALGSITNDESAYQEAWARSKGRSVRAQRCLARVAQEKKQFDKAAEHWELALAINPLHAYAWFALGYCALKTGRRARAVQAFTRCVQQEPHHGDAWNNLAALHLQEERYPEAFSALSEAVKLNRDSWRTWENYARTALATGNALAACRGLRRVYDLSQGKQKDVATLAALVAAVQEHRTASATFGACTSAGAGAGEGGRGVEAQVEEAVGQLLADYVSSGGADSALWQAFADFQLATGHQEAAEEALYKRVRALQNSGWQQDVQAFDEYASAVMQLCRCYMGAAKAGRRGRRDVSTARMQLSSLCKKGADSFPEHERLAPAQEMLREAEQLESSMLK